MRYLNYSEDQDSLQDSLLLAVKDLFESCEDELLPIHDQLRKYKKRNLNASHANRTTRKVFGSQKALCRNFSVNEDPFENTDSKKNFCAIRNGEIPLPFSNMSFKKNLQDKDSVTFMDELSEKSVTEWVNDRKKLRHDLKRLGDVKQWLENKQDKTCIEENVLKQFQSTHFEHGDLQLNKIPHSSDGVLTSVPESVKRIAHAVSSGSARMNQFNKLKSSPISQEDFINGLSKVELVAKLSTEDKQEILRLYYNPKTKTSSFCAALTELVKRLQHSTTPLITITPATAHNGRSSSKFMIEDKPRKDYRSSGDALNQQQKLRREQFEATVKKCQEENVGLSESRLQKVLLHPEDRKRSEEKQKLVQVSDKSLLSENFWKVREKRRSRRRVERFVQSYKRSIDAVKLDCEECRTRLVRRRGSVVSTESRESDDDEKSRGDTRSLIILPPLRDVAPEKHHVNLSTGRALVGRKVDCWMSAEEYMNITKNPAGIPVEREPSNPNAFWPGRVLDKTRLWRTPCDTHQPPHCNKGRDKGNIFHTVGIRPHNGKKSNYGYNNNELTWPTDGIYVKYGDIELKKTYQI